MVNKFPKTYVVVHAVWQPELVLLTELANCGRIFLIAQGALSLVSAPARHGQLEVFTLRLCTNGTATLQERQSSKTIWMMITGTTHLGSQLGAELAGLENAGLGDL